MGVKESLKSEIAISALTAFLIKSGVIEQDAYIDFLTKIKTASAINLEKDEQAQNQMLDILNDIINSLD